MDPHPAYWKPVRLRLTKKADGTAAGEMDYAAFKLWVRGWRREPATGDIVCEVQEHPDPAWEAWKRTLDERARAK